MMDGERDPERRMEQGPGPLRVRRPRIRMIPYSTWLRRHGHVVQHRGQGPAVGLPQAAANVGLGGLGAFNQGNYTSTDTSDTGNQSDNSEYVVFDSDCTTDNPENDPNIPPLRPKRPFSEEESSSSTCTPDRSPRQQSLSPAPDTSPGSPVLSFTSFLGQPWGWEWIGGEGEGEDIGMEGVGEVHPAPSDDDEPIARDEPRNEPIAQDEPRVEPIPQDGPRVEPIPQDGPRVEPIPQDGPRVEPVRRSTRVRRPPDRYQSVDFRTESYLRRLERSRRKNRRARRN